MNTPVSFLSPEDHLEIFVNQMKGFLKEHPLERPFNKHLIVQENGHRIRFEINIEPLDDMHILPEKL